MSDGPDMEMRDPNGLNDHVKVLFEDVFGEPEGVRSLNCVWRNSFRCFSGAKRCCYVFLTTLCAIPIALCWGFKFACISFCHIWQVAPMLRVCQINIGCIQKMYSFIVNCACAPCCEAFALFFSKITVRNK